MSTIGLYSPRPQEDFNALRARLNALAATFGYTAERGPTAGQGNLVELLEAIDAGEVALVLLPPEHQVAAAMWLEARAAEYAARAQAATDPRSEASLRAHATRALRDAEALEAKVTRLECGNFPTGEYNKYKGGWEMPTAQEIRDSYEEFRAVRKDWDLFPIVLWGKFTYVVLDKVRLLQDEMQRIGVVDITNRADVARFAGIWPEQAWDDESRRAVRRNALVSFGESGGIGIMSEDGGLIVVSVADLPIRVVPGTAADAREVRRMQMEELEAAVDAGGPQEAPSILRW